MEFLTKYKRIFLLAGMAVCVTAIILTLRPGFRPTFVGKALGFVITPLQQGATAVTRRVGGFFSMLSEMSRLQAENAALKDQISLLTIDNQRLRLADEENKKLSALLEIGQKYADLPKTGAEIIGKDPNDWYDSFHIDKGTLHGLTRNMAVLGDGGLVGVIRECYPNYAKVITLIDSRCSVAVKNVRTEDIGILKGDVKLMPQGLCRMEYINADAQIMPGDEIVTSAHSAHYPPGILVGTVLRVEPNLNGLTKYAIIQPAANIDRVETVWVVTKLYGDENQDAVNDEPVFLED